MAATDMSLALLAFRGITRNRFRTSMTLLAVAIAVMAFITLRTVLGAWSMDTGEAADNRLVTTNKVAFVFQMPQHYATTIQGSRGVQAVTWTNFFDGRDSRNPRDVFASFAVDPESYLRVYPEIVLAPEDRRAWLDDRQGAIVGDLLAERLHLSKGDNITLKGTLYPGDWPFRVSGIFSVSDGYLDRTTFFFHWQYLNERRPFGRGNVGWIYTLIDDPARVGDLSVQIDRLFAQKTPQTRTRTDAAMRLAFAGLAGAVLSTLDTVSVVILLILALILGNTISMAVRERRKQYGTLRVLGFRPRHIRRLIIGEAAVLGLVAGIVGAALSYPIVQLGMGQWLSANMGVEHHPVFQIEYPTVLLALVLSTCLGVASAFWPAMRAAARPVGDALRRID